MKTIEIEIDLFAKIWSLRREGESDENEIIKRIVEGFLGNRQALLGELDVPDEDPATRPQKEVKTSARRSKEDGNMFVPQGKVRWVDDVQMALKSLGGKASLHEIYKQVESIRKKARRSLPKTLEATIRRTIEDHSSDSDNFRGRDLFEKRGRGIWSLRNQ